jgi:tyrosine-protein kinase Etk/Wzc
MVSAENKSWRDTSPAQNGISIREVWILAVRHRRFVLAATFGSGVLAAIITLFIPNQYTAITTILPPQQNSSLSSVLTAQLGGLASLASLGSLAGRDMGLKDPNDIYIGMLQSRTIEDDLIKQFSLASVYRESKMSKARKVLEKHSTIKSTKTGLISISFEDRDPNRAAQIANTYVQRLQELSSNFAMTEAGRRRKFFDQQLQDAQAKLIVAEQQLKQTQQQTGVLELEAQMKTTIESMARLKAQIAARQVELDVLSSYATEENSQRELVEKEIAGLQAQLAILEEKQNGGKGDLQVPTSQIPSIGMTYLNQVRDVRYYETMTELLAKQFEVAKLDEARQGAVLQVLDPAVPPDTNSFPIRWLIALLAALIGLLGSTVFLVARALLLEPTDSSVEVVS